jgi:metal-responsive CopG/Arc/MetJ family transcriptional regulator
MITIQLPDRLFSEVEKTAKAEGRSIADVLSEAFKRYTVDQRWQRLVDRGEQRAKRSGITEADVPQLVEEIRRENQTRER